MANGIDLVIKHIYMPSQVFMNCVSLTDSEVYEFDTTECVRISRAVL